jgi:hypothetical protein
MNLSAMLKEAYMRIAGTFRVVNGQNVIQGRPEDQPNAPLGTYPVNDGDTVLLVASAQLGMGSDASGVDLNPQ